MKKYYLVKNSEKIGPYSISELQDLDFDRKTLVWHNGLDNWKNAEDFEELSDFFQNVPPPIPSAHDESVHNIKIVSPIEVNLFKKKAITNEEQTENLRKITNKTFSEIGYIILYFTISIVAAFLIYQVYFSTNKPPVVSDENQRLFNREFAEKNRGNPSQVYFGEIYYKYLGSYKYDDNLTEYDLSEINEARISILKDKTEEIAKTIFFVLFAILIIVRYVGFFMKWLNPQKNEDVPLANEDNNSN